MPNYIYLTSSTKNQISLVMGKETYAELVNPPTEAAIHKQWVENKLDMAFLEKNIKKWVEEFKEERNKLQRYLKRKNIKFIALEALDCDAWFITDGEYLIFSPGA